MQGRSLELYFIDGRPDGLLTAEVVNWTGHVLRIPRTRIATGLTRPEAGHTGVYILLGERDRTPTLYIGEAKTLLDRLRQHLAAKDWWDEAILVTASGDALHKAHVKYFEALLVDIALSVRRAKVENGNTPARSSLNEAASASMEAFLDTLLMVLPAIRVDQFDEKRRSKEGSVTPASVSRPAQFTLTLPRHGVTATARLESGEMVVEKSAHVRPERIGDRRYNTRHFKLHDDLVASGVIARTADGDVFIVDIACEFQSAAAALACGRTANGGTSWMMSGTTKTCADRETWQLAEAVR